MRIEFLQLDMLVVGLIFAQFPDPCTPVSTPEPDSLSSSSLESKPSSSDSNESLVLQQKSLMEKEHPLVRPYSELGDGQVSEILSKHLEHFQVASKRSDIFPQKEGTDIVLYKEAMEHCARLYRILVSNFFSSIHNYFVKLISN